MGGEGNCHQLPSTATNCPATAHLALLQVPVPVPLLELCLHALWRILTCGKCDKRPQRVRVATSHESVCAQRGRAVHMPMYPQCHLMHKHENDIAVIHVLGYIFDFPPTCRPPASAATIMFSALTAVAAAARSRMRCRTKDCGIKMKEMLNGSKATS